MPAVDKEDLDMFISEHEYSLIRELFYKSSGIMLGPGKKSFIQNRLQKRLPKTNCTSYEQYYKYIMAKGHEAELEKAINLLTTNETYFFRESAHFSFFKKEILKSISCSKNMRIWSAASSTGEEAYSLSMILEDQRPDSQWEVIGTDLNTDVLIKAAKGIYPMARLESVPFEYLKKFLLKGKGDYLDYVLVDKSIRTKVKFLQLNLMSKQLHRTIGMFDIIFLRNVMIYFSLEERQILMANVLECLPPGGWLIIGLSESLMGIEHDLVQRGPSIYQRMKKND